ncbi:RABP2 protein, partial [Haliaeetus albicilla]|nr:RABP2 protein [Haliaeetus albicilla]
MPNFSGNWKMKSSENFEELLKALGVNMMLRKIAVAAASKPAVEIKQDGETFYIKTSTTVRTTEISFRIGEEFEEQTVDGRPCKVGGSPACARGLILTPRMRSSHAHVRA